MDKFTHVVPGPNGIASNIHCLLTLSIRLSLSLSVFLSPWFFPCPLIHYTTPHHTTPYATRWDKTMLYIHHVHAVCFSCLFFFVLRSKINADQEYLSLIQILRRAHKHRGLTSICDFLDLFPLPLFTLLSVDSTFFIFLFFNPSSFSFLFSFFPSIHQLHPSHSSVEQQSPSYCLHDFSFLSLILNDLLTTQSYFTKTHYEHNPTHTHIHIMGAIISQLRQVTL